MLKAAVIGLDLAGVPKNPSGFALLFGRKIETKFLYPDAEIVEQCVRSRPKVVAIDAPLSLPEHGSLRAADEQLIERGLRVFPPMFAGMKKLTTRGIKLAGEMRSQGLRVIEIHPRSSGIMLFGTAERTRWVSKIRRKGWQLKLGRSEHEIDAVVAALTGMLWLKKKTEEIGDREEGTIVIPCGPLEVCGRAWSSGRGSKHRRPKL
jgi:hypothetical protein